ncbi:MAG: DUF3795 domain-containing protein [Chloroflexota bacterium]
MKLSLNDVNEEDRGVVSPCGIICLGCDAHTHEGLQAAKTLGEIWEGFNLPDVAVLAGLKTQDVCSTLETLREYVVRQEKTGPCPGCFKGGGPSTVCSIAKCVRSKGYWTCAECPDFSPESDEPCLYSDTGLTSMPLASRREASALIRRRYSGNNVENLSRCREVGYPAFIAEAKEKVRSGWRTWQVISSEMLFTRK